MTQILWQLPYSDTPGSVAVGGELIPVLAHQIIVWVSVTVKDASAFAPGTPRIPAIFDTGTNFGFAIPEARLVRWCGLEPLQLEALGSIFLSRQPLTCHAADVWLHCNRRKRRDTFRTTPPLRLRLEDGIAVYPADTRLTVPRLPVLGLRAVDENGLRCTINGRNRTVSLSTTEASATA